MSENTDYSEFVVITPRLQLKAVTFDYLQDIFSEFTDEIAEFIPAKASKNIAESALFIHKSLLDIINKKTITCVILDLLSGEFIGNCAIQDIYTNTPTFGIWIKKSAQGRGYGFEVISALKRWAEQNLQISGFKYKVSKLNIPSNKIAQKLEGVVVDEYPEDFSDLGKSFIWVVYQIPLSFD